MPEPIGQTAEAKFLISLPTMGMAPKPSDKMTVALRVLNAFTVYEQPDHDDVLKLRRWVTPEQVQEPPDALARAVINHELEEKRENDHSDDY
jgi:hypothetical protein